MKITIKKESSGIYNVYTSTGKTKKQIAKLEDLYPNIKQTTTKPKSFFLWVKNDGVFLKHKISWFHSMLTVKQWLRESIETLGYTDWLRVNGLEQSINNIHIKTILVKEQNND